MDYTFDVIPGTAIYPLVLGHIPQIVELVQATYEAHHHQQTVIPASPFLCFPHHPRARIIPAPAYLGEPFNVAGLKWVASFPDNIQHNVPRASAVLVLNDPQTGYPYTVLEGSIISAARTAASAVLAAQILRYHERRVTRLGFLGTGLIARYIYTFFHSMGWDIAQVVCADAQRTYAEQFAAMVQATGQPDVTVYDRAEDVLRVCDVTVLATTAASPHIHTADILAYNPLFLQISLRDLTPELIVQAQNIVDDVDHVLQAQTSVHLAAQTMGHQRFITGTLGAVLAGTCQVSEAAPLVFSPFGLGILDLAVGQYIYAVARAQGTHRPITDFFYERTRW